MKSRSARIARTLALVATLAGSLHGHTAVAAGDPALRVRNRSLEVTWTTPDTRPAPFDQVMLAPIGLQFRATEPMKGPTGYTGTRDEFPVTPENQRRIAEGFDRIFREELSAGRKVRLTETPGPGVLLVKPALRDIVSRIPPEEPAGRSYVYADSVGEATLVLEFVDAASGRVLGTAMDRRTAEPAGAAGDFGAVRANSVGAGQEVRRLARRWGTALAKRVEQLYFEAKPR